MKRKRRRGKLGRIPPHFWRQQRSIYSERNEQYNYWEVRHGVTSSHSVPLAWVDLFDPKVKRFVFQHSPSRWDPTLRRK